MPLYKVHFFKIVNGHLVCRYTGLYAGMQDCMQVCRTVYRYAGLYGGMQDCMKSLNIFCKQRASQLRELQILGDFVVTLAAVLRVSTNYTLSSIFFSL